MFTIGIAVAILGALVSLFGTIWFLRIAFREHILWGLGCILFGPVSLVFLILHLQATWRPFLLSLVGTIVGFGGVFLLSQSQAGGSTPIDWAALFARRDGATAPDEAPPERPRAEFPTDQEHDRQMPAGAVIVQLNPQCRTPCSIKVLLGQGMEPFQFSLPPGQSRNVGIFEAARVQVVPNPPSCAGQEVTITPQMAGQTVVVGCGP